MKQLIRIWTYSIIAIVVLSLQACNKTPEDWEDAPLRFSQTEVCFDTIFTTIGSVTQSFTVHNPHNIMLSVDVHLAGGTQSPYSINVDGTAGTSFSDVKIPPKDSIFVHVMVNINPNDQTLPFIVKDSIIFSRGRQVQDVDLVAFGQNARFIVADQGNSSLRYKIVAQAGEVVHWTNELPYVVYGGYAAVDSLGTLIIDPGTTIYFHHGAGLWVYRYGNIQAVGTVDQPITFRGDQLSRWYENDYAQWDRIWINEGVRDNHFEHCIIKNAFIGMQVEALSERLNNQTLLKCCIIRDTQGNGILARNTKLTAENCLISNNGSCSMQLEIGEFDLKHITLANYFSQSVRKNPALYLSNTYNNGLYQLIGDSRLSMQNSIIYGLMEDEVGIYSYDSDQASVESNFQNCLVKKRAPTSDFVQCIFNQDPHFTDHNAHDYTLQSSSPAIDAGIVIPTITTDLNGNARDDKPDIGAYEY